MSRTNGARRGDEGHKEERRYFPADEIRAVRETDEDGNEVRRIVGHAAVFDQETEINGWFGRFREKIAPGAFLESIARDDVRTLWNHDSNIVLGRSRPGRPNNTLRMVEDETGLMTQTDPPTWADQYMETIERGDVDQMSFGFLVEAEEFEKGEGDELDLRTIKKAKLFDVSPVAFPAYEGTDVGVRGHTADSASYVEWRSSIGEPVPEREPVAVDEVDPSPALAGPPRLASARRRRRIESS